MEAWTLIILPVYFSIRHETVFRWRYILKLRFLIKSHFWLWKVVVVFTLPLFGDVLFIFDLHRQGWRKIILDGLCLVLLEILKTAVWGVVTWKQGWRIKLWQKYWVLSVIVLHRWLVFIWRCIHIPHCRFSNRRWRVYRRLKVHFYFNLFWFI